MTKVAADLDTSTKVAWQAGAEANAKTAGMMKIATSLQAAWKAEAWAAAAELEASLQMAWEAEAPAKPDARAIQVVAEETAAAALSATLREECFDLKGRARAWSPRRGRARARAARAPAGAAPADPAEAAVAELVGHFEDELAEQVDALAKDAFGAARVVEADALAAGQFGAALDEPVEMAQMEEEFALIEQVEALAGKLSIAKIKRFIVAEGGELPAGRAKKARYVRMAVEVASRRSWGDAKAKRKKARSTSAADIGVSAQ